MSIAVVDPFGAHEDSAMPTLALAIDPIAAGEELKRGLPRLAGTDGKVRLRGIEVIRYKPARRCVIQYKLQVQAGDGSRETVKVLGKVRARRFGNEAYRLLQDIWESGFGAESTDAISVPEPLGVIPRLQMWVQRKVPGKTATGLLPAEQGQQLAKKIAEAIHKLHQANVPTDRRHSMQDELRILGECLAQVRELKPELASRVQTVATACERLGATVSVDGVCGIHRDFYPAQVLVDGERVYLIDFDLYCLGDPALDIGNFIGHMIEQGVREAGSAEALREQQHALEERFVELSGSRCRAAIHAYTTLTVARHIYLSTQFVERTNTTEPLLRVCEERLGLD
jgi:hypothetical protein